MHDRLYAWVQVPRFQKYLTRLDPTFDLRTYEYKNMLALLRYAQTCFGCVLIGEMLRSMKSNESRNAFRCEAVT